MRIVHAKVAAVLVHILTQRVAQDDVGRLIENGEAMLQVIGGEVIVVSRPEKELSASEFRDAVVIRSEADVCGIAGITHARIGGCVGLANLLSAVGRGVVADDQLQIAIGLPKHTFNCLPEVFLSVINGKADAYAWKRKSGHASPFLEALRLGLESVTGLRSASSPAAAKKRAPERMIVRHMSAI
jgi:hypothetical protein